MKKRIISLFMCVFMTISISGCKIFERDGQAIVTPSPAPTEAVENIDPFLLNYINHTQVTEDIYIVMSSSKKGYGAGVVDISNETEIIEPVHDDMNYIYDEEGNVAFIAKDGDWFYFFDMEGNQHNKSKDYSRLELSDGAVAPIRAWTRENKCVIITAMGDVVFEGDGFEHIEYDELNEVYIVNKEGLYGVVNKDGEMIIPVKYAVIRPGARANEYIAKYNGGYGLIDGNDNVTISFIYTDLKAIDYTIYSYRGRYYEATRLDGSRVVVDMYNNVLAELK